MVVSLYAVVIACFLLAFGLTAWVRRMVLTHQIIDRPNSRSSHSHPTPRGGGMAIVITSSISAVILAWLKVVETDLILALLGGGILIAWVGFMDDRGAASVRLRFCVHVISATWAMYVLGGLPALQWGDQVISLGWIGNVIGTIAIVWTLNLFNFMDGIDGIAASEAVFITGIGAALGIISGVGASVSIAAFTVGAASLGFLVWNWPPAKIFMGDVGSGYLGYVIAVLALASAHQSPIGIWVWLILGGVFFVDATLTLFRRLLRRERIHEAHRSHAYQWLSRRWQSHLYVTTLLWLINVFWLLPLAWLCVRYPHHGHIFLIVALGVLIPLSLISGSGRAEKIEGN